MREFFAQLREVHLLHRVWGEDDKPMSGLQRGNLLPDGAVLSRVWNASAKVAAAFRGYHPRVNVRPSTRAVDFRTRRIVSARALLERMPRQRELSPSANPYSCGTNEKGFPHEGRERRLHISNTQRVLQSGVSCRRVAAGGRIARPTPCRMQRGFDCKRSAASDRIREFGWRNGGRQQCFEYRACRRGECGTRAVQRRLPARGPLNARCLHCRDIHLHTSTMHHHGVQGSALCLSLSWFAIPHQWSGRARTGQRSVANLRNAIRERSTDDRAIG